LEDCVESFHEGVSSKDEAICRKRMMAVAEELLSLYRSDREMVDNKELNAEGREYEDEEEAESEEEVEG
jgi:hypothetical protein